MTYPWAPEGPMLKPLAIKWGTGVFLVHPQPGGVNGQPQMIVEPKRGDGGGNPVSGRWQARFTSGYLAGEVDWRGPDGAVLSWRGPWSRYFYDENAIFTHNVYYKGAILATLPSPVYNVMGAAIADFDGRRYLLVITTDEQGDKLWARRLKGAGMEFQDATWDTWWSESHTASHPRPWFFSPTGKAASHVKEYYELNGAYATINYEHWVLQIDEGSVVLARDPISPVTLTGIRHYKCDGQMPEGSGTWTVTETDTTHETANGSMLVAEDYDSDGNVIQLTAEVVLRYQINNTISYTFKKEVLPAPPPNNVNIDPVSFHNIGSESRNRTVKYYINDKKINEEKFELSSSGSTDFDYTAGSGTHTEALQRYDEWLSLIWADLRNGLALFLSIYGHELENGSGSIVMGDNIIPGTGSHKYSRQLEICGSISVKSEEVVYIDVSWNGIGYHQQQAPSPYECSADVNQTYSNDLYPFEVITMKGGSQATRTSACLSVDFEGGFHYLTGGKLDELSGLTSPDRSYWPVFYVGESSEGIP